MCRFSSLPDVVAGKFFQAKYFFRLYSNWQMTQKPLIHVTIRKARVTMSTHGRCSKNAPNGCSICSLVLMGLDVAADAGSISAKKSNRLSIDRIVTSRGIQGT